LGGARPVFCDIDLNTYNIDPAEIEGLITRRTKAIMVVHQFGLSADMQAITEIAGRHNLSIIEDAACALGAEYKGKKVGSFGSAGVFSFHPRKIITCGEGGCLVTNSSRIAKNISLLRNHGEDNKRFVTAGYNFRLTDIQAALLLSQIGNIEKTIQDRRRLAECYQGLLGGLEGKEMLKTPVSAHPQHSYRHTYQSYVLLLSRSVDRDKLKGLLRKKGIETQFGTYCLPLLNFFKKYFKVPKGSYKNACHAYSQTLTLPLYHGLEKDGQMRIAEALTRYIKKCAG
jgi:dTDP-4-amino-4,6-dideoxygalactose transaminase